MEQSKTVALTKKLLRDYYEYGDIVEMETMFSEDVIAFGIHSDSYATGKDKAAQCLRQMYYDLKSCRVTKLKCVEKATGTGWTVRANIVFSTENRMRNMHQVLVIYTDTAEGRKIGGLHFQHDVRHELLYQSVSSRLLNRGEIEDGSMDEVMDMVASYVNCAYVQYRPDQNLPIDYYSEELWRMLGYKSGPDFGKQFECRGVQLERLIHPHDLGPSREEIKRQLLKSDSYQVEYRLRRSNESYIWCIECGRYVLDRKTGIGTFNAVVTNLSPLKQTHASFLYNLRHDRLTNLYNKKAFCRRTAEVLADNPDTEFEIMRFNIARFKVINDLFGEETGDKLLRYIAHFLKSIKLEPCVYGRLYADNFLLCYPTRNDMRNHMISSLQMLAETFALDYRIDFYFGVYTIRDTALSVTTMIDRASMGLAKAAYNGVVSCGEYGEDMRDSIVNEQVIVNNMHSSLDRGEFLVYIQPKYELMGEKIVGGEALVRWLHPQLGFIPPSRFIPIFEKNGFIYRLDKYVWERACQILREDMDAGRPVLPISVNVSRIDFYSPNIVQVFEQLIAKYDIPPRLLELELTESAYVENPQQIIEITKELQRKGFPILMDDFGSGYSSLNMLKDMPVDILKIDLQFLSDSDKEDNGRGGNILNSVVRMAKWLHIPVIAEGVEKQQQVDFLRTIGCECVQGYFFSKPVPLDVYREMTVKGFNDTAVPVHLGPEDTVDMMTMSAQLTVLFNGAGGAIGLYELVGGALELLRANDGYFKLFGDSRDNVYGPDSSIIDRIDYRDRELFWQTVKDAEASKGVCECELRRYCSDGRLLWIRVRVSIIYVEQMRTLLYLVMEDVTPLAEEREHLQRMLERLRAINPQEVAALEQEFKDIP
ncbi:PAS domain S-box-containing protein/diguanylate cyclase (GGDEF) domain-containing protein [Selenomonas sp. GACV-9]|uniref:EAL domain-containing protein n=1 Tax=Selenomonas sp. GACV-9 TaxID=3158782 RepID=UPI0008EB1311|nr:PAS domain S-box-containing protein/diguanylate cyclase (GGDEF) domain-containing protein [Selenomonas ruminantium]